MVLLEQILILILSNLKHHIPLSKCPPHNLTVLLFCSKYGKVYMHQIHSLSCTFTFIVSSTKCIAEHYGEGLAMTLLICLFTYLR